MLRIDVADTVNETELGKTTALLEGEVPNMAVSGLLEAPTAGAVVKGALGSIREYTMTGEPPELETSAFDEVKDGRSRL